MIDYAKILTELEEERATCQYVYGGMIPAFYTQALHRAIEAVKECQDCAAEAGCMAKEVSMPLSACAAVSHELNSVQVVMYRYQYSASLLRCGCTRRMLYQ